MPLPFVPKWFPDRQEWLFVPAPGAKIVLPEHADCGDSVDERFDSDDERELAEEERRKEINKARAAKGLETRRRNKEAKEAKRLEAVRFQYHSSSCSLDHSFYFNLG